MRNIKWLLTTLLLVILCIVSDLYISDRLSHVYGGYTRTAIDEMYSQTRNIDLVFTGASHTYRSLDPQIFDEALSLNSFNAGSSSQRVVDTYYYLNEIIKNNDIDQVIFEFSYNQYNQYDYLSNPLIFFILHDYLRPSINNLSYMFNGLAPEYWHYSLVRSSRYIGKVNTETITAIIEGEKLTNYDSSEVYLHKGFVYSYVGFEEGNMGIIPTYQWSNSNINEQSVVFFNKIMELCQKKDIEVILITVPTPISTLVSIGNYQEVHDFFSGLSAKHGIVYYDFNLVKPEIFSRPDSYFYDDSHLNGKGATDFSKMLVGFLQDYNDGSIDHDQYLYDNFDDLWADIDSVLAVGLQQNGNVFTAKSLQGKYITPEYQFLLVDCQGIDRQIQAYSSSNSIEISLDANECKRIRVNARAVDSTDLYQAFWELEINQ